MDNPEPMYQSADSVATDRLTRAVLLLAQIVNRGFAKRETDTRLTDDHAYQHHKDRIEDLEDEVRRVS